MQNAVKDSQAKVDNSEREKAQREATLGSAEKDLDRLEHGASAAKDATEASKAAVGTAKANLASATEAAENKDEEIKATADLKAKLEATLADVFEPCKTKKAKAHDVHTMDKVF